VGHRLSTGVGGKGPVAYDKFAPAKPCLTLPVRGFLVLGREGSCCLEGVGTGWKEDTAMRQERLSVGSHQAGCCSSSGQGTGVSELPRRPQRDVRAPQTSASATLLWGRIQPFFFLIRARNAGRAVPKYEHLRSPRVTVFDL